MNFFYKLSRTEFFLATFAMYFHQSLVNVLYALCILAFVYVGIDVVSDMDSAILTKVFVILVFTSFPIIVLLILLLISALIGTLSKKNQSILLIQNLTINENLFIVETETSRSEVQWKALKRVAVGFGFVFLYLSQSGALIIPKRSFASGQEWKEFIYLCRSKLQK